MAASIISTCVQWRLQEGAQDARTPPDLQLLVSESICMLILTTLQNKLSELRKGHRNNQDSSGSYVTEREGSLPPLNDTLKPWSGEKSLRGLAHAHYCVGGAYC